MVCKRSKSAFLDVLRCGIFNWLVSQQRINLILGTAFATVIGGLPNVRDFEYL